MLTDHQNEKLQEALEILKTSNRLLIKGSAGVGKTFLVDILIQNLRQFLPGKYLATAPTNKAVSVLADKITDSSCDIITTHKALSIKRVVDNKLRKAVFKSVYNEKYPPLKGVRVLIIDEASMIPLWLQLEIEEHAIRQNTKVIWIGDVKQINPVGELDSPVFLGKPKLIPKGLEDKFEYTSFKPFDDKQSVLFNSYPSIELTEIVRQKGDNPIIDLSRNLTKISSKQSIKNDLGGYIYTEDFQKIIFTLAATNGTDELKYLSYTNADVDRINSLVRKSIYGENPAKIELGETLIFKAPYKKYYTNQEVLVDKLILREEDFKILVKRDKQETNNIYDTVKLKYYSINYSNQTEEYFKEENSWESNETSEILIDNIRIIHEDSEKDFERIKANSKLKMDIREIKYSDYLDIVEMFADVNYNHALTIHNSQGSTYRQTILNVKSISYCKEMVEKERLLYTAVTRASNLLILYNS